MTKSEIKDKVEEIWDKSQKDNIGSNEAELEFKENISEFILKNSLINYKKLIKGFVSRYN